MRDRPLRILFLVQGEGRGHMTQALAVQAMLHEAGHEVAGVCVGAPPGHEPPAFFRHGLKAPLTTYASPVFVRDRNRRGIRLTSTVGVAFSNRDAYRQSLKVLHDQVHRLKPDAILNFYDLMGGLYGMQYRPKMPIVAVGHQYLMQHPHFVYPPGWFVNRGLMHLFNRLTSYGACQQWALSYYCLGAVPDRRLLVLPPLLRPALFELPTDLAGDHLHVYLINDGYAPDILAWHRRHPNLPVHCFCHRPGWPEEDRVDETFTFHQLNGDTFLRMMARAQGVVCTAGFESVSEAMYLGKHVFMVPLERHYEQYSNAYDAVRYGAGQASSSFDLDPFLSLLNTPVPNVDRYRRWVNSAPERMLGALRALVPPSRTVSISQAA